MTKVMPAPNDKSTLVDEKVKIFLKSLQHVFSDIETWSRSIGLRTKKEKAEISEEMAGTYSAPILRLIDKQGKEVAVIRPIGTFIIGASGRFDIEGRLDRETVVLLGQGGPVFETSVSSSKGAILEKKSAPMFRGVDKEGWYWIESRKPGRARLFDKELFGDLVNGVSDYEA